MTKNSNQRREASAINPKLNQRLAAYVAAASATAIGTVAATPAAEAKIVYTPTHIRVTQSMPLDLNHDGIADFTFQFWAPGFHSAYLDVMPAVNGNAVRIVGNSSAACGFLGVPVGPGGKFGTNSHSGHGLLMADFFSNGSMYRSSGPWADVSNRYLGFKFLINGQVHYGWARMSVSKYVRNVELTGYAYETTPNVSIIEGSTSGGSAASVAPSDLLTPAQPRATLGMLARGADGLALWRREEENV